jgi:hypothetical protein
VHVARLFVRQQVRRVLNVDLVVLLVEVVRVQEESKQIDEDQSKEESRFHGEI